MADQKHTLWFKSNFIFTVPGPNITIRRGIKWAATLKVGDEVTLKDVDDRHKFCEARITNMKVMPFQYILLTEFALEHDPACRTPEGAFELLSGVYPGLQKTESLTLIYFDIIDDADFILGGEVEGDPA